MEKHKYGTSEKKERETKRKQLQDLLKDGGLEKTFREKVRMIEQAVKDGIANPMKEFGAYLDVILSMLETNHFKPEDIVNWPIFKDLLIKRRSIKFNTQLKEQNFQRQEQIKNKDLPATMDHVESHIAQSIESGGAPKIEKIFNLSKNNKEDPPLNGFVKYYAYRSEERKFNILYPEKPPSKKEDVLAQPKLKLKDTNNLITYKVFLNYICDKKYTTKEYFISQNQYLDMEFMNQVPEIVCDILYYLSGYIHHRTDQIPKDVYTKMLKAQIENVSTATQEHIDNYNNDGWMYDAKGIDRNVEALVDFSNNFKRLRDAKPTAEE